MSGPAAAPAEPLAAYQALLAHSELELELAGRAEVQRLAELWERWEQLTSSLPASPPPQAAQLLARAQLMHERTRVELLRLREALLGELAEVRRARAAAEGYDPGRARPMFERSA